MYLSNHLHSLPSLLGFSPRKILLCLLMAALPQLNAAEGVLNNSQLPDLGASNRQDLSPIAERKLGEEVMRDIRRNRDYLDDAPTLEYLNNFGNSLVAIRADARGEAGFDYFFFAVRDPMINAFALPGGFIGLHSALILAAQSESEVASVLAHEIGHVSQRHIARMLGQQKQDSLIPLAAMLLAVLAARSNPDASMGILATGEGIAVQRQLNFSRDAEREADRIGFQILQDAKFDTSGMVAFFGRMQTASRAYNDSAPAYLRSHPLTTERIADIDARNRSVRYKQRADSLDFHLIRARIRVLQDESVGALQESKAVFENQMNLNNKMQTAAALYGLSLIAARQGQPEQAESYLQRAYQASRQTETNAVRNASLDYNHPILANQAIELALTEVERGGKGLAEKKTDGKKQAQHAVELAAKAQQQFPLSRGLARQYAQSLIAAHQLDQASSFLRDQIQLYRQEPKLHEQLAQVYAKQGKIALQHMSLAENYALQGSLPAALEQLQLARRAPDGTFYDQALIDAKERQLQTERREQLKDQKSNRSDKPEKAD